MQSPGSSYVTAAFFLITQVLGSPSVWCDQSQQGAGTQKLQRWMVSGLHGDVSVRSLYTSPQPLGFNDTLNHGDEVNTGTTGMVEILLGKQALVTAYEDATLRIFNEDPGHTVMQLMKGDVRVAISRGDQALIIRTPTTSALSYGGLLRITVTPDLRRNADAQRNGNDRSFRAIVASDRSRGKPTEIFHVLEGRVQIQSSDSASSLLTVETGQALQVVAGHMSGVVTMASAPMPSNRLPATDKHALLPARSLEQIAARDKAEAQALQRVLLDVPETSQLQVELRNVILSTSFGVQNALQAQSLQPSGTLGTGTSPVITPPTQARPDLTNVVISTSVGVQLPEPPQQTRGQQPPTLPTAPPPPPPPPPATPPAIVPPSPPPAVQLPPPPAPGRFGFNNVDLDDFVRGRGRGRGERDDDLDERLFKGLVPGGGRR